MAGSLPEDIEVRNVLTTGTGCCVDRQEALLIGLLTEVRALGRKCDSMHGLGSFSHIIHSGTHIHTHTHTM